MEEKIDIKWLLEETMNKNIKGLVRDLRIALKEGKTNLCIHQDTFDWTTFATYDCPNPSGCHNYVSEMEKCMETYNIKELLSKLTTK